jgi:asparagine synthase (glutamine-hydrolysing)
MGLVPVRHGHATLEERNDMCGIAGIVHTRGTHLPLLNASLHVMNDLQHHRGPDGRGTWVHSRVPVGFGHVRLSIIDIAGGAQPMTDAAGNWITYNGEVYNYRELRDELSSETFRTASDTEVILAAYRRWGADCVDHLQGMFAFALWDEAKGELFCARDRFGIKPFYYTTIGDVFYFASEAKALLPFVPQIETDLEALKEYLAFQFCLGERTLFKDIRQLQPGHTLRLAKGSITTRRYWEVYYDLDFRHTSLHFEERLLAAAEDSVRLHVRSDVPIGAYVSGGLDSSVVASMAARYRSEDLIGFTGRFDYGPEYDESAFARAVSERAGFELRTLTIDASDFVENIRKVIFHLDYPTAGPGSFPQYMIARFVGQHRKVVLGGQGGDEVFGGYTRYLLAYFEQCIKAAIDGTTRNGNFVVTYESIIPNLTALRQYKPLIQEFWREGLFDAMDLRYFRLVNRAPSLGDEINWNALGDYSPFETFRSIFNGDNVRKESYFDLMTHFDFKTLLPALLQVEDRVSMAHGVESRVPLLDHSLVELAATIPADIKFVNGQLKHIMKTAFKPFIPDAVFARTDKMGFPTPLTEFTQGDARTFVRDIFGSSAARSRGVVNNAVVLEKLDAEPRFGRKVWGLLSLELWQQEFHDKGAFYRGLLNEAVPHTQTIGSTL